MKRTPAVLLSLVVLAASPALAGHAGHGGRDDGGRWQDPAHYPLYQRPQTRYSEPPRRHHHVHRDCDPAPRIAVVDPYYCNVCRAGFRFRHKFYHHINHDHRIALEIIPRVVVRIGSAWVYFD